MKIINGMDKISIDLSNVGLTIGNFDGVHSGHRRFLSHIKEECEKNRWPFIVVTFVPHPKQILVAAKNFLLNINNEKQELLEKLGVDFLVEIDFTRDLSSLSPNDFLDNYIFEKFRIGGLFFGYDFAFGKNKAGNFRFIRKYCKEKRVKLIIQEPYIIDGDIVSSSLIRKKIESGDIETVTKLLEKEFCLSGIVIKGKNRGAKLGFPTANIEISDKVMPQTGVYFSKTGYDGVIYNSITNIGVNPTFNRGNNILIETHIIDFDHDVYGEEIVVSFYKRLRDEIKFECKQKLIQQIKNDIEQLNGFFYDN